MLTENTGDLNMLTPLVFFFVGYSLAVLGLQTSQFPIRCGLMAMATYCILCKTLPTLTEVSNGPRMKLFGPLAVIGWSHAITLLLIERYELPRIKSGKQSFDIIGGTHMLANGRYIGTPREVSGLKRWPEHGNPMTRRWLPSKLKVSPRWVFVIERLVTVFLIAAIEYVLPALPIKPSDLHPKKAFLFRRLTDIGLREVWLRCLMPFNFVFGSWLTFNFVYQSFAAVTVALGMYQPNDWPRLFGDLSDAHSVRGLWAKFWHRLVYRPYGGWARLVLDKIPGMKKDSPVYWTLMSFIIFTISGCVHAIVTVAMKYRCGWWADLHFYLLQFFGIALEETVNRLTRGGLSSRPWLGYFWVFCFLFWSLPKLYLPHWKWNCIPRD